MENNEKGLPVGGWQEVSREGSDFLPPSLGVRGQSTIFARAQGNKLSHVSLALNIPHIHTLPYKIRNKSIRTNKREIEK